MDNLFSASICLIFRELILFLKLERIWYTLNKPAYFTLGYLKVSIMVFLFLQFNAVVLEYSIGISLNQQQANWKYISVSIYSNIYRIANNSK